MAISRPSLFRNAGFSAAMHGPIPSFAFAAALIIAVYLPTLSYPFMSDDSGYLGDNARLLALRTGELWRLWRESHNLANEYLPLRDLSYWIDLQLFGLQPAAYRIHNLLLHGLALPLVYALTLALYRQAQPSDDRAAASVAAATTLLYALHPAQVEVLVWISGRKYALANLFSLLALFLALRARAGGGTRPGLSPHLAIATLLALVAVMQSKSSQIGVALVVALFWLRHWQAHRGAPGNVVPLLYATTALALSMALLIWFINRSTGESMPAWPPLGTGEYVTRVLATLAWLARLCLPWEDRHFFYPLLQTPSFPFMAAAGGALLASVAYASSAIWRRASLPALMLFCFFLLIAPYGQWLPFGTVSLVQDRYVALATWPIAFALVIVLHRLPRMLTAAAIALLLGLCVYQSHHRAGDWQSFERIVERDWRAFPDDAVTAAYQAISVASPRKQYEEARAAVAAVADPLARATLVDHIDAARAVEQALGNALPAEQAATVLLAHGQRLRAAAAQVSHAAPLALIIDKLRRNVQIHWLALIRRFPANAEIQFDAGRWHLQEGLHVAATRYLAKAIKSGQLSGQRLADARRDFERASGVAPPPWSPAQGPEQQK